MSKLKEKLKRLKDAVCANGYVKLFLGESRKNSLRKSRRNCLIIFTTAAAFMLFLMMSIGGALSGLAASVREIDYDAVASQIAYFEDETIRLAEEDVSEYSVAELHSHNNAVEEARRNIAVLTELERAKYDGNEYSVLYTNGGETRTFGLHSFTYDSIFRTGILSFISMLLAIFCSITVANVFGAEYSEKTSKLMFTKPATRVKLFLCKMAVVLKELVIYVTIAFLLIIAVAWASGGLDFCRTVMYFGNSVRVIGAFEIYLSIWFNLFIYALFYALLASLLAVGGKSRVLPIFGVLLFSRLYELTAVKELMMEAAQISMPVYNATFINHVNLFQYFANNQLVLSGTSYARSFLVLAVYIVALFFGSLVAFKRQHVVK